jgi:hypothetical protein
MRPEQYARPSPENLPLLLVMSILLSESSRQCQPVRMIPSFVLSIASRLTFFGEEPFILSFIRDYPRDARVVLHNAFALDCLLFFWDSLFRVRYHTQDTVLSGFLLKESIDLFMSHLEFDGIVFWLQYDSSDLLQPGLQVIRRGMNGFLLAGCLHLFAFSLFMNRSVCRVDYRYASSLTATCCRSDRMAPG